MNLRITLQVTPGEEGMAESHTYLLKEVKTVSQCTKFLYSIVSPFIGEQADLADLPVKREEKHSRLDTQTDEEDKGEASAKKKRGGRRKKAKQEEDDGVPWDTSDDIEDSSVDE